MGKWVHSLDKFKKIAVKFSENEDGDGFVYDFGEEHGANTFEECKKLFTPVVLHINTKQETYPLCEWLKVLLENGFPVNEDY